MVMSRARLISLLMSSGAALAQYSFSVLCYFSFFRPVVCATLCHQPNVLGCAFSCPCLFFYFCRDDTASDVVPAVQKDNVCYAAAGMGYLFLAPLFLPVFKP